MLSVIYNSNLLNGSYIAQDVNGHQYNKYSFTTPPLLWKFQLKPVLITYDLLCYVDGSFPCNPQFQADAIGNTVVKSEELLRLLPHPQQFQG